MLTTTLKALRIVEAVAAVIDALQFNSEESHVPNT